MGHATAAFTADVYVTVADELLDDAASRISALRRARRGEQCASRGGQMSPRRGQPPCRSGKVTGEGGGSGI